MKPIHQDWEERWGRVSRQTLPAAMTGSLMSSLVMGQRNSQGIPEEKESLLSSSTLLHSLLRRPTDSAEERDVGQGSKHKPTLGTNGRTTHLNTQNVVLTEWEVWLHRLWLHTKNTSSLIWTQLLLSANSCCCGLHHLLSSH